MTPSSARPAALKQRQTDLNFPHATPDLQPALKSSLEEFDLLIFIMALLSAKAFDSLFIGSLFIYCLSFGFFSL